MHAAVAHVLQFFAYDHLPPKLQELSKPFAELAHLMVRLVPADNPEVTMMLRKLLEAKDCAVRARVSSPDAITKLLTAERRLEEEKMIGPEEAVIGTLPTYLNG